MVDFVLDVLLRIRTAEAKDNVIKLKNEMDQSATQSKNKWKQAGKALAGVGILAGGVFAGIVAWSPSLMGMFAKWKIAIGLTALSIGEELAPALDQLTPMIQDMTHFIQELDPEMQQFIGLTIAATVAIGAMGVVIASIAVIGAPLVLFIIGLAALIALLYMAWENNFLGIRDIMNEIMTFLENRFGRIGDAIGALVESVQYFGEHWEWVGYVLAAVVLVVVFLVDLIGRVLFTAIETVIYLISDFMTILGAMGELIVAAFTLDGEGIARGFVNVIVGIANLFVDVVNFLIGIVEDFINAAIDAANRIPGVDIGHVSLGRVSRLETFHEGRKAQFAHGEGMAWLKSGEVVETPTEHAAHSRGALGGGSGGNHYHTYHINLNSPNFTDRMSIRRQAKQLFTEIDKQQRRKLSI